MRDAATAPGPREIDAGDAAAALRFAGRKAPIGSPLHGLEPPGDVASRLAAHGLLDASQRELVGWLRDAIEGLARPTHRVVVQIRVPSPGAAAGWQAVRAGPGPWLVLDEPGGDRRLVRAAGDADAAARALLERLCHGDVDSLEEAVAALARTDVDVDGGAFVALIAVADATRATALRAELARSLAARPLLTPELLHGELLRTRAGVDGRWAGARLRDLPSDSGDGSLDAMRSGLVALASSGLLEAAARGYRPTPLGERVVAALNGATRVARVEASVLADDAWATTRQAYVVVGADGAAWWFGWSAEPGASVTLRGPTLSENVKALRVLLDVDGSPAPVLAPVPAPPAAVPRARPRAAAPSPSPSPSPSPDPDPAPAPAPRARARGATPSEPRRARAAPMAPPPAVPSGETPPAEAPARCPNAACDALLVSGKKFCTRCGTRVPGSATP